ncbi:hypothetical protein J23TS9_01600 [Paenibacillus sp. J23TS9]|nr:hypothetical protein J23TS9_01600 [Paenibacillus sp. J23TS9]
MFKKAFWITYICIAFLFLLFFAAQLLEPTTFEIIATILLCLVTSFILTALIFLIIRLFKKITKHG